MRAQVEPRGALADRPIPAGPPGRPLVAAAGRRGGAR